jgi:hypothetical protein
VTVKQPVLSAREFDATRNEYSVDVRVRADVFIFAVQTQREPASYEVLDISHREFWVVSGSTIREWEVKTVGSAGSVSTPRDHSHTATLPMPFARRRKCIDSCRCGIGGVAMPRSRGQLLGRVHQQRR